MNKTGMVSCKKCLALMFALFCPTFSGIGFAKNYDGIREWQLNNLFHPSHAQRDEEANGLIMIYAYLTDKEVEQAMDTQFERIESMMFTNVIITSEDGEYRVDEQSGEIQTEDDGC